MDERRKCERVRLPESAGVYLADEEGKRVGRVLMLGSGGLVLETTAKLVEGSPHHVELVAQNEHIRRLLIVVARCRNSGEIALDFRALDIDAAIDLGILIGKYSGVAHAACA